MTFLDLLLLVVMVLVLVPFVLNRSRRGALGEFQVSLRTRGVGRDRTLILEVSAPENLEVDTGTILSWSIRNSDGEVLHHESDLPPITGKTRIFYAGGTFIEEGNLVIVEWDGNRLEFQSP